MRPENYDPDNDNNPFDVGLHLNISPAWGPHLDSKMIACHDSNGDEVMMKPRRAKLLAGHRGSEPCPQVSIESTVGELEAWALNPPEVAEYEAAWRVHNALVEKAQAFHAQLLADTAEYERQQQQRESDIRAATDKIVSGGAT